MAADRAGNMPSAESGGGRGRREARRGDESGILDLEQDAHAVAERLPDLLLEADRIAATVAHGIHGRRRAGPGETFWQFRPLEVQDSASLIDWRRSAASDSLFVREREWEAAHTLWLWPDLSPSMSFKSRAALVSKRDRAIVLTLATAELLVRSGERVGLFGLMPPTASRRAARRFAEAILANAGNPVLAASQPPASTLPRFSSAVVFGDFLDPIEVTQAALEKIAGTGVGGHMVQILDPAEESFPFEGRTEFVAIEGDAVWIADRAESLREAYKQRLARHRADLLSLTTRLGWSFMVHHTDRPAAEPLLALIMRLEGRDGGYRWAPPVTAGAGDGP